VELKLQLEEVGKQILEENVRVFRFPEAIGEDGKLEIQQRLSEHSLVRLAGRVVHIDGESVSFLTNEFVVKFKAQVTRKHVDDFVADNDLTLIRTIPYGRNTFLLRSGGLATYDILNVCARVAQSDVIEYAQPNLFTSAVDDFTPDDFLYGQQPHHQIINSEDAWDITTGDSDIIVAVVDSGCDFDHPDFTNDPAVGWDKVYRPYDFVNMDTNPTSGTHGTKSAGIAVANGGNSEGVTGVAYGCRLMPIRRPPGGTDVNHADMYVWIAGFDPGWTDDGVNYDVGTIFPALVDPGADVITNSFGYSDAVIDGLMKDALDFATTFGRGGKGCVVLFSVGNGSTDFTTYREWAEYEKTIAVASSAISPPDAAEVKVRRSNYGAAVDVCAPGGGHSGGGETRTMSTTQVGLGDTAGSAGATTNDYDDFGQTSCACPQVAGVAALMLSVNPDLTWLQVRQIIRDTAVQIDAANTDPVGQWVDTDGDGSVDFSQWYGHGRIDAHAAVQAAEDLVAVDPVTQVDTWIMENATDIGEVPESAPYLSPDVWVRNLDPAVDNPAEVHIHQSPIREQDNWVYANIRNRGAEDSLDVYVRISITRWAGTQYVYPDDFIPTVPPSTDPIDPMGPGTYLIGEVHIESIPAGGAVTINTVWPEDLIPPATVTIDGVVYSWADSCLLVEVSPHDGPTPAGNNTWDNNNLCQRNLTIIDPTDDDDVAIAFVAGHRTKNARMLNVRVDRKNLPAGVKLYFDHVDQEVAYETKRFLEELKDRPEMLETCDLTVLTEARGEIHCSRTGEVSEVTIAPKTNLTLTCCPTLGKTPRYRLKPVVRDNRVLFELPTHQKAHVPVPLKRGRHQVLALIAEGLRNLKKGEYQIDVYQEDMTGKTEGGVNFVIRKGVVF
jgi:subtilisin family serine protease